MRKRELMGRNIVVWSVAAGLMVGMVGVPCRGRASGPGVPAASTPAESKPAGGTAAFDPNTDPNLVAWWKLDGDATDNSGHGLAGRPQGGPQWAAGRIGGAVQLDGVDDYIDCGAAPALGLRGPLTVACWVKVASFHRTWETILAKGDSSYRLGRFRDTGRGVHFACTGTEPSPPWLNAVAPLADDRWHHVAGVYDGSSLVLYVDGREMARKDATGSVGVNEHPLYLGGNAESGGRWLGGLLDDVRLYNRGLSAGEVAALVGPGVGAAGTELGAGAGDTAGGPRPPGGLGGVVLLALAGGVVLLALVAVLGWRSQGAGPGAEPGMVWKIARKEFLLNVMTFKFTVATIACVVLAAVFTPILAKDYQQRLNTYRDNVARNEAELRKVKVYKDIVPTVFRLPTVLSVFNEGLEKRIGDSSTVELDRVPEMCAASAQSNPYQSIFPVFDISLIFRVVLSTLALLVAYDAVSGDKERGTLKLILAGSTRRHQMLLAKLLAGLLVLVLPVTVTFLVALLLLLSFPMVDLTRAQWLRVGLMYLTSLVFVSAMYNLGLLFSCLSAKSIVALVLGIFAWVGFVVVVPNGAVYLATELRPLEPEETRAERVRALRREYQEELSICRPPDDPSVERIQSDAADAFGRSYHRLLNKFAMDYYLKEYEAVCSLGDKYADAFWRAEHSYLATLFAQNALAGRLARISPVSLYDDAMSALAGTDVTKHQSFVMALRTYRNRLVDYLRSKTDNFTAPRLFTPYTLEEMEHLSKETEPPPLDLRDLPQFAFQALEVRDLRGAASDLVLLVVVNLIFFSLSLAVFMRYDVR